MSIDITQHSPVSLKKYGYATEQIRVVTARFKELTDVSENVEALSLRELVELLDAYKQAAEVVKSSLAAINTTIDNIATRLIPDKMTQDGVRTATFEGIGRVQMRSDIYVHVPADQREALQQWLRDHDMGELVVPTVNNSTLKAMLKERMKAGDTLPDPGVTKITPVLVASIVKA